MTTEEQRLLAYSRRRPWRLTIATAVTLLAVGTGLALSATPAHADMQCSTTYSGDVSYTLCRYFNPWQHATMTQCGPYGCMTRED